MSRTSAGRRALRWVWAGLMGLLVAVGLVAGPALWARWQAHGRVLTATQAPTRDVAIVFGAEVLPNGTPSRYLRARLDLGARLYREGKAKVLIVSGDNSAAHHHESTNMRRYLEKAGVPSRHIVEDEHGLDTYDTCVRARDVFGVTEPLLVSQRYHLTRAVATCRAVGVNAIGVGDVTMKQVSARWGEFSRRELGANIKMVVDLASSRTPVRQPPSDAVRTALANR